MYEVLISARSMPGELRSEVVIPTSGVVTESSYANHPARGAATPRQWPGARNSVDFAPPQTFEEAE